MYIFPMSTVLALTLIASVFIISCTSAAGSERKHLWGYQSSILPSESLKSVKSEEQAFQRQRLIKKGVVQLDALLKLSESHSPKLFAAFNRWKAAVYGITVSTALPDATLSYSEFIDSIETRLGPIERRFAFEQRIPNPGKLSARQESSAYNARAMRANFEATRLALRESVLIAVANLRELDAKVVVIQRLTGIVKEIEEIIETRVATNQAAQAALLRVQVEKERLENDLSSFKQQRPSLLKILTAVTGVDISNDILFTKLEIAEVAALPEKALLYTSLDTHPSLNKDLAKVAIAKAKASEAGWSWIPDFSLGFEYQQIGSPNIPVPPSGSGHDAIAFKVGITIPWQLGVNSAREEEAEAREEAAKYAAQQTKLNLRSLLDQAIFAFDDAYRLVNLYEESVLPKARQALDLSQADFVTDKASLTDVLDAERALLAGELSLVSAKAQLLRGEAKVESLIAQELDKVRR